MKNINLQLQSGQWHKTANIAVCGYCFDGEHNFYDGERLLQLFATIKSETDFQHLLQKLNGIFSVVVIIENSLFATSDKSRVVPLFYSFENETFSISDNPYNLLSEKPKIDKEAEQEFLLSSIILDEKTLIEGIFQIKPACYLCFENEKITQKEFYSYRVKQSEINTSKTLEKDFSTVLEHVFRRLIRSANGRQIVIPLSGGYDSRLIAAMLKKLDYRNVVCYTVGRENNPEYRIAKEVAQSLGFRHYFIFTGDKTFLNNYTSDETFQRYYTFSGSFVQFFWMYEYFGVKYLINSGLIEKDAIFVPGYAGDFLAGSRITAFDVEIDNSQKQIAEKIARCIFTFGKPNEKTIEKITKCIANSSDTLATSVFDDVVMKTGVAKLINNATRLHNFFGHDVRLPFWDNEILEFFRTLPPYLKYNKSFYANFLKNSLFKDYNINFAKELQIEHKKNPLQPLKELIRPYTPKFVLRLVSNHQDYICMNEMTAILIPDLKKRGVKLNTIQTNEILTRWYLMKIKEDLKIKTRI